MTEPPQPSLAAQAPRGRVGTFVAWLLIIASVGYLAVGRAIYEWASRRTAAAARTGPADRDAEPSFQLLLAGRYAVGAHALISTLETARTSGAATAPTAASAKSPAVDLLAQVDTAAGAPDRGADHFRAAIVAGEIAGAEAALSRLAKLKPAAEPSLRDDVAALEQLYTRGPYGLTPQQQAALVASHGWFGELALVYGKPPADPQRREVIRPAIRTMTVAAVAGAAELAALVAGLVLLVVGIVMWAKGSLGFAYQPPPPDRPTGPFLEAFAAYLFGMVVVSAAISLLMERTVSATWFLVAIIPFAFFWPRLRGVPWAELRYGLGWTAGRGLAREAGAGVLGYFAGLPLLAAGALVTLVLQRLSGADTAHPIVNEIVRGGRWRIAQLFLLAAVWAPVVEETMFRGAFYHHLRRRLPWPAAAGLVGLLFAAVHPQGWAAVPALAAIGFSFATIREWRGSIAGPVVAHALNNGTLVVLMVLMFS